MLSVARNLYRNCDIGCGSVFICHVITQSSLPNDDFYIVPKQGNSFSYSK